MEKEKLINYAVIIDRFLKIFQTFFFVIMIICAVFIPLAAIFGEGIIASADTLTVGHLTLKLNGEIGDYMDISKLRLSLIMMMICGVIICAAVWFCLKQLREIVAPMKEGRPFEAGISGKIRKLGWTVLIAGGITEAGRTAASVFELMAYDLSFLESQSVISGIRFNYSIDLWFVFTALFLFFMSYVFRCGEILQTESDETL